MLQRQRSAAAYLSRTAQAANQVLARTRDYRRATFQQGEIQGRETPDSRLSYLLRLFGTVCIIIVWPRANGLICVLKKKQTNKQNPPNLLFPLPYHHH